MSLATLLTFPSDPRAQAAWSFDHAHEHGKLVDAMHDPSAFNLMHYLLDPMPASAVSGASNWDMVHQQAHDDAAAWFSVQPSLQLVDASAQNSGDFQVWLFTNQQEHVALSEAALKTGLV